ncbi:hypothetical protein IAD21_06190 [Abditibacteriota bacterium]|nr:hypothetical protein IAD21_06190 [Abditibacteriota bacterium]
MKTLVIRNPARGNIVCPRVLLANNFWTRGKGLLGRKGLDESEGILLVPGSSIHMFGMKFAIDVVFLTKDHLVTDFVENIGPGKAHVARNNAGKPHSALEIAAGTISKCGVQIGDQLELEDVV